MNFAKRLQPFFNVDGGAGGGASAPEGQAPSPVGFETPATPTPTGPPAGMTNPLLEQAPVAPQETLDFGGRKVPVVDPSLRDLHNDYTQLTSTYQQTNQQNQLLQQQVQFFQQQFQAMQQQQQAQAQAQQQPAQPQLSPEEIAARNQQWMDSFYENPLDAMQQVIEQAMSQRLDSALQPIQQMQREREYATQITGLQQKYQDFNDVIPKIQELNAQNPQLVDQIGLENLYWMAKGQTAQTQPQYTPQQMMNDPQFRQQILSNDQIKQQIITSYLQNVQQQQAATPPVMGSNVAGQAPMSPPMQPKTIAEGSKAFRQFLSTQN